LPTIPDKPLKNAATPTTNAGKAYVSPNRDEALVKAELVKVWALIFAGEAVHDDR
jgi:hypothetical protein